MPLWLLALGLFLFIVIYCAVYLKNTCRCGSLKKTTKKVQEENNLDFRNQDEWTESNKCEYPRGTEKQHQQQHRIAGKHKKHFACEIFFLHTHHSFHFDSCDFHRHRHRLQLRIPWWQDFGVYFVYFAVHSRFSRHYHCRVHDLRFLNHPAAFCIAATIFHR